MLTLLKTIKNRDFRPFFLMVLFMNNFAGYSRGAKSAHRQLPVP